MFLYKDCYVNCWTGSHLIYTVFAGVCLAFYIPVAVYMRPKWQETQHDLNVFEAPIFLMVKSVFQITIVALKKTVGRIQPVPFGIVYIAAFSAYFVFLKKVKPYNYNRFCLWELCLTLGVIWITMLTLLHDFAADYLSNKYFAIMLFQGWLVIAAGGLFVQQKYRQTYFPSLLYFPLNENYSHMFRFQFLNGKESEQHLKRLSSKTTF